MRSTDTIKAKAVAIEKKVDDAKKELSKVKTRAAKAEEKCLEQKKHTDCLSKISSIRQ